MCILKLLLYGLMQETAMLYFQRKNAGLY